LISFNIIRVNPHISVVSILTFLNNTYARTHRMREHRCQDSIAICVIVKVDGWHRLSAVSVDKVGVYFRETEPDKKSATGLNAVS
jgi:hypothetical protein